MFINLKCPFMTVQVHRNVDECINIKLELISIFYIQFNINLYLRTYKVDYKIRLIKYIKMKLYLYYIAILPMPNIIGYSLAKVVPDNIN